MTDDDSSGADSSAAPRDLDVVDNHDTGRYEVAVGPDVAFLTYRRRRNKIALIHTEVPASLRGQGVASLLAKTALETARGQGLRVVILCPYVKEYVERHPEYQALTR
jgi:uncharacterized protein